MLVALTLALVPACRRSTPQLASCREPLSGVWLASSSDPDREAVPGAPLRGDERLGFDVRDDAGGLSIYPLWDTSRPTGGKSPLAASPSAAPPPLVLSPWRITLTRAGDAAVGTIAWRLTQAGRTCAVQQPARLSACSGRRAILDLTLAPSVDPATCVLSAPPRRLSLALTRQ